MKRIFSTTFVLLLFLSFSSAWSQTYTHPTTGVQNSYNGACAVSTCSGTSYDNGGSGSNYSANVNSIYRTFFPGTAGQCMRATFTSFSMNDTYFLCVGPNNCCDYLSILDGPIASSPALYSNCTTSPGTVTSTTGPLTFRFVSDGSVQLAGWAATLSCVPCAGGQNGNTNSDAAFATALFGSGAMTDASDGPGIVAEGCSGCMLSEAFSNWYTFTINSSGTLAFTLDPNQDTDDFDFALYGPNANPAVPGSPVRCSAGIVAGNGNTGMGNGAADASEDITGDQWASELNVTAGESYLLLLNAQSATAGSNGFDFLLTGTAGITGGLPVDMLTFSGTPTPAGNLLEWATAQETGNDVFLVEHSLDNELFMPVGAVKGAGTTTHATEYRFLHGDAPQGISYYRLKQVDTDGQAHYSATLEVRNTPGGTLKVAPNPATGSLTVTFPQVQAAGMLWLTDPSGRQVLEMPLDKSGEPLVLDISDIAAGLYFMTVMRAGEAIRTTTVAIE